MTETLAPSFTALDLCDRCNARAYFRVTRAGHVLWLCGHHGREHHAGLVDKGWRIENDNR